MTYVPRGRTSSSRTGGGRNRRNDTQGQGGDRYGNSSGNDSSREGGRSRGGNGSSGRSGRGAGPQRDGNRRHSGYGERREPQQDGNRRGGDAPVYESQPRPEHVEFGNGARKPGMGRGRGRGRAGQTRKPEHLGNRLPPEERMLPDDYGNRIDQPERPARGGQRRDAQGSGRNERQPRQDRPAREQRPPRGDRGPRQRNERGGDYVDEHPAPRFVDREQQPAPRFIDRNELGREGLDDGNRRRRSRGRRGRGRSSEGGTRGEDRQGPGQTGPEQAGAPAAQASERQQDGSRGRRRSAAAGNPPEVRRPAMRTRPERSDDSSQGRVANRRSRAKEEKLELDIIAFIRDNPVVHEIEDIFEPTHMFSDFGLSARLLANVEKRGYEAPTPIQDVAIPPVKEGRDVVGLANTGTGKTAAFLLPLIDRMLADKSQYALVLAPTRELAIQIEEELQSFTIGLGMRSTVIVGGVGEGAQLKSLRADNRFIIATPGRLIDFIKRGELSLDRFNNVVLDEADRMLDMGFIRDMRFLIGRLPRQRQTLFFSATMSEEIRSLIGEFLHDPVTVSVVRHKTAANVQQEVISMAGRKRFEMLVDLLGQPEMTRVLVFGRTKHGMNKLSNMLNREGLETDAIHGNKSHNARQLALKRFKEGSIQALVATDVAARGLDIDDVSHVINFELPQTYDDYIHRIGRTGRAGRTGHAITFIE
ncbi:MAG: DEAD/DEAH box helicase [Planctomycetales bacterium]|nr:DEAD/DEAH box helicase [bacterium]UNM08961.1 MAG: DEAD/DEAH box helicase [Planctomycetales bacterium]